MINAIYIRKTDSPHGFAALYRLEPPLQGDEGEMLDYVIVSAANKPKWGLLETYIFPANQNGEITDFGELDGSFKGGCDHVQALNNAGYQVVGLLEEVEV